MDETMNRLVGLVEAEQKDLARFMTPVQRARYVALQAQFRRRAQEMAQQNGGKDPAFNRSQGLKRVP